MLVKSYGFVLVIFLMNLAKELEAKLACQIRTGSAAIGNGTTKLTPGPGTSPGPRIARSAAPATHCCGSRPFNADASVCCLGRVLRQNLRKCCLDGTNVPVASRCLCYPTSHWIMEQIDRLSLLETNLGSLIEELHDREFTARREVLEKQKVIAALDARANKLFQSFLRLLGIDRNKAPREVDDIIETIRFLNTNEQNTGAARKNARNLEESEQRILDVTTDNVPGREEESEGGIPDRLRRIRREIERLRMAAARAEEVSNQANEGIDEAVPDSSNQRLRVIILERDLILKNLTKQNRLLRYLRDRLLIVQRLKMIAEADRDLAINLRGMMDLLLDEVIHMEVAREEEFGEIMKRKRRDASYSEKRTRRSLVNDPNAGAADSNCNFTPWDSYVESLDRRRNLVLQDLNDLLAVVDGDESPPVTLPRSTRAERSFFAPRLLQSLGGNPGPRIEFRERRDLALEAYDRVKHLSLDNILEETGRFRKNAFSWMEKMSFDNGATSGNAIAEKFLSLIKKAKPH